jgi:hypothetical protein
VGSVLRRTAGRGDLTRLEVASMPPPDPILEEIHAIREELALKSGYDAEKIAEAARKRQAESGRTAVTLPPRPIAIRKRKAS